MTAEPSELDAATLVGLLADDDRRAVAAALILGESTLDGVVARTGLTSVAAAKALGRLVDGGLVVGDHGGLHLLGAAFARAARGALARPARHEHDDAPDEMRRVLEVFVVDGRITAIPSSESKRLVILDWLAQFFEPGRRYSEPMVNLIIGQRHADTAAWRRYLVDHEFLARAAGEYWRIGGTFEPHA